MRSFVTSAALLVVLAAQVAAAQNDPNDEPVTITLCEARWASVIPIVSYVFDDAEIRGLEELPDCPVTIQQRGISKSSLARLLFRRYGIIVKYDGTGSATIRLPPNPDRMCPVHQDPCDRSG